MKTRIVGFDLARAYALFGMFVVNFNVVFGLHEDTSPLGRFLSLFNGNSSTAFVMLAGMGLALMTNRPTLSPEEKQKLRTTVVRRSWFLLAVGLLLFTWWPADILHFYGGYLPVAALVLFVPRSRYLMLAVSALVGFHGLLALIPYETGWDFATLRYTDFWTLPGFLRNTFYNGWNPMFPWMGFFFGGMWLGRLDWRQSRVRWWTLGVGGAVFSGVEGLQTLADRGAFDPDLTFYLTANYLPPFLPFMLGTSSSALVLLVVCLWLGDRFADSPLVLALTKAGQMTLTHYVIHLTLGMVLFSLLSERAYTGARNAGPAVSPGWVLGFAVAFFMGSVWFSQAWSRRFKHGPLETLMRRIAG